MPDGCWFNAAASLGPPTTSWVLVYCRGPDWLNCTLARSTVGQESPELIVRTTILNVAEAPLGSGVATPFALR